MEPGTLRRWCERWRTKFDWRAQEARLNGFDQFIFPLDRIDLHFLHVRGEGADATPLLLMNGWPSTFAELSRIVEPLTRPSQHGGGRAFDVVIPSLPGYGFSGKPAKPGWSISRMAKAIAGLMTEIGYERFGVHGSDMGAGVMLALAMHVPERLVALHSVNVYWGYPRPADPKPEEKAWLDQIKAWQMQEGTYAMVQGTKPQTWRPASTTAPRVWPRGASAGSTSSAGPRLKRVVTFRLSRPLTCSCGNCARSSRSVARADDEAPNGREADGGGWRRARKEKPLDD